MHKQTLTLKLVFLASFMLAALALVAPSPALAAGQLERTAKTPIGMFGGIEYLQHDGIFEGSTATGTYRVPFRIFAPANPGEGNGTVLVEPSHFAAGLGTLDFYLGREFELGRGFAHAGIGWSTATFSQFGEGLNFRILDPTVPGVFINGGFPDDDGRTDDEIISDYASALASDPEAQQMLGQVERRYLAGFSDSSDPVLRLVTSGLADKVIDFALPITAVGHDPQQALQDGLYDGKLIIVNSEDEGPSFKFIDQGAFPDLYRFYAVAGTPHISDNLDPVVLSDVSMTTPASYLPALHAHFLQGDAWVKDGTPPPASTHLKTVGHLNLARDENGNAIVVDASGNAVPRQPYIELGEAHYISGFIGSYDNVKTITELGFTDHQVYLKKFAKKLVAYRDAGYILPEEADEMLQRAKLCPPLTYTETYRDHYDNFTAIVACDE